MGKMGNKKWRFHGKAIQLIKDPPSEKKIPKLVAARKLVKTDDPNPFETVRINNNQLLQTLPDFSTSAKATPKTPEKQRQKTKKEKLQERQEIWMQKFNAIESAKRKEKELLQKEKDRKKMKYTPIVGDLTDMKDNLPVMKSASEIPAGAAPIKRFSVGLKARQKEMMENINIFKQVLSHSMFKRDPGATITEHLQNKVEEMNTC